MRLNPRKLGLMPGHVPAKSHKFCALHAKTSELFLTIRQLGFHTTKVPGLALYGVCPFGRRGRLRIASD